MLAIEQTTIGPPGVGTRYREIAQMLPFLRGEILSVLTRYGPGECLEEDFAGARMRGRLAYRFVPKKGRARLVQQENIELLGFLRVGLQ